MYGRSTLSRLKVLLWMFARSGRWISFCTWLCFAPPLILLTRFTLALDELLYPDLLETRIEKPVFIMGHPRSGTSFFQRRIFRSGAAAMFTTWELFVPSVALRRALRPIIGVLRRNEVDVMQSSDSGHEVRLAAVEEDEGLFLHRLDTEMLTFLCPRLLTDPVHGELGFKLGWLSPQETDRSMVFYKRCLRRNLYHSRKARVVAKCNPSVFRLKALMRHFPDARIVYVVRRPEQSVRSFLAFTKRFVSHLLPKRDQQRYFRRKYEWGVELYRYFEEAREEIPKQQLLVLSFDEIVARPDAALAKFFDFTGLAPGEDGEHTPSERRPRSRRKAHVNDTLVELGISPEEVRRDLRFVRDRYFPGDAEEGAQTPSAAGGVGS